MTRRRIRILPYRQGSASARALADALGGRVLKLEGSKYSYRDADLVINWGRTQDIYCPMLNEPSIIRNVSNKLNFFNLMRNSGHEDIIPQFWTSIDDIPDDAFPVVCRTVLAGHSGDGIVLANSREELVRAPLYTKYIKKQDEYRVHIGRDREGNYNVIAVQRKARRHDLPDENINWQVRNHSNGFVFTREGFIAPDCVTDNAKTALRASGLDFGGVDIVYNQRHQQSYVIEINSACGLQGSTIIDYANYFRGRIAADARSII